MYIKNRSNDLDENFRANVRLSNANLNNVRTGIYAYAQGIENLPPKRASYLNEYGTLISVQNLSKSTGAQIDIDREGTICHRSKISGVWTSWINDSLTNKLQAQSPYHSDNTNYTIKFTPDYNEIYKQYTLWHVVTVIDARVLFTFLLKCVQDTETGERTYTINTDYMVIVKADSSSTDPVISINGSNGEITCEYSFSWYTNVLVMIS